MWTVRFFKGYILATQVFTCAHPFRLTRIWQIVKWKLYKKSSRMAVENKFSYFRLLSGDVLSIKFSTYRDGNLKKVPAKFPIQWNSTRIVLTKSWMTFLFERSFQGFRENGFFRLSMIKTPTDVISRQQTWFLSIERRPWQNFTV